MKVFVLGGEGFVGSAFVRAAKSQGHVVRTITRENYDRHRGKKCELFVNADGNSRKYLADQDAPAEFEASVVSVLRSLLDFEYRQYVYLSTIDVYPRADDSRFNRETAVIQPERLSRYGLHKWLAEQLVRRYADRWLIVRLGGMVGEGLWKNPVFDILHGKPLRAHENSRYQYLNTEDVARIVLDLARRQPSNDVFNVCGEGSISLREIAAMVPGHRMQYATEKPRKEHYEINVAKLRAWLKVPKTKEAVCTFLRKQLS